MSDPLVQLSAVSLGYGAVSVLTDVTFTVYRGDFLAFVGPNGSGKTTLLRALTGALTPLSGEIHHAGGRVACGYVPQERELDPVFPLSALDVVLLGRVGRLGPGRRPGRREREICIKALDQVGVGALARTPFQTLSGGQKQRVLIARALVVEPDLLVLDEPTGGMDVRSERELMDLIASLQARRLSIVMASHNLHAVANYAKRIAIVDRERAVFRIGDAAEILTDDTLSALYGLNVRVRQVEGQRTIITGGDPC
ncbi:MAG: metal ABC transporter ATP-binding protein [Candidatus Rokubacteria bacterium]|nr:metal ABC transporter ATP-binding protein [Candidatus Rokubacteria bacterium]